MNASETIVVGFDGSTAQNQPSAGRALHRPARLAVPAAVLRAAVGTEMATEFLPSSQRAFPHRLLEAGFKFADPELLGALTTALSDHALVPDS